MSRSEDAVSEIMSRTVKTIADARPVRAAVAMMTKNDIGSVVVVKGRVPVGIITERDVMRRLAGKSQASLDQPSGRLASKPLITVSPETMIWEAFILMLRRRIRRLPVTRDGKLVGIVTERDLFKWVVGVLYAPNVPQDVRKLIAQNP